MKALATILVLSVLAFGVPDAGWAAASGGSVDGPAQPTAIERLVRQEKARRNDPALGITRATQVVPLPSAPRIVVVGAGLAGLACAHRLVSSGVEVVVHEAGTRVGGRCWTHRGAFASGQIVEHGGELIDQADQRGAFNADCVRQDVLTRCLGHPADDDQRVRGRVGQAMRLGDGVGGAPPVPAGRQQGVRHGLLELLVRIRIVDVGHGPVHHREGPIETQVNRIAC